MTQARGVSYLVVRLGILRTSSGVVNPYVHGRRFGAKSPDFRSLGGVAFGKVYRATLTSAITITRAQVRASFASGSEFEPLPGIPVTPSALRNDGQIDPVCRLRCDHAWRDLIGRDQLVVNAQQSNTDQQMLFRNL